MIGGYSSRIFEVKPFEKLECPLCFEILKDPLQCSSGHPFCKTCISSALEKRDCCPVCKVALTPTSLSRSLFVQQFIEDLITVCVSHDDESSIHKSECTWKGPLHSRSLHYERDCGCFEVECENAGCGSKMLRKSVSEHNEICHFALVKCNYCDKECTRKYESEHHTSCEKRPVLCPNNCSAILSFSQVQTHLLNNCPNKKVSSSGHLNQLDELTLDIINTELNNVTLTSLTGASEHNVPKSSKNSKKNAKKAAKRKNIEPNNNNDNVDDLLLLKQPDHNVELNTITAKFMETMPKVMATLRVLIDAYKQGPFYQKFNNLTAHFFSFIVGALGQAGDNELYYHFKLVFIEHENSLMNLTINNIEGYRLLAAVHFAKCYVKMFGGWFLSWLQNICLHSVHSVLSDVFAKILDDPCEMVNAFQMRENYRKSIEITVSGAGIQTVNGIYHYLQKADCFRQKSSNCSNETHPYIISLNTTAFATLWSICSFANGAPAAVYCQIADSTDEAVPSETKPWLRTKYALEKETPTSSACDLIVTINAKSTVW